MKKVIFTFIAILILLISSLVVYWNLPFEINRKSEIKFGNELIEKIELYKKTYKKLPKSDEWKTLEKLGFKIELLGTKPSYESNNGEYELVFYEGFDGPYLMWNSKERKWKIDFQSIFSKAEAKVNVSGKSILFLRPSDEKFDSLENQEGIYEVDADFGFAINNTIDSLNSNPKFKGIKNMIITERLIEIEDCKNYPKIIDRDSIWYGIILTGPNKEIKIISNVQTLNYIQEIEEYFK